MSDSCQVSVYMKGDALDPDVLTRMLGVQPTKAHRRGHVRQTSHGTEIVENTGLWSLTLRDHDAEVAPLIAELDRIASAGGCPVVSLPGVQFAFVDVLLIAETQDRGGATLQTTLDPKALSALLRLGVDVELTFAAVVP